MAVAPKDIKFSKIEAIKALINIMESTKPDARYRALIAVAGIYDPDPFDDGDGEPLSAEKNMRIVR